MADGQIDQVVAIGTPLGIGINIPTDVSFLRAKVIRIDYGISMEAERAFCTVWQGDRDITAAASNFNTADQIRSSDFAMFPLKSWMSCSDSNARTFDHFSFRPSGLYINDEQKVAMTIDPTAGAGHVVAYLSVLFMGTG